MADHSQRDKRIRASIQATRERRKSQTPRAVWCKVDESRMSHGQREDRRRLYLEAKWVVNDIVSAPDVFEYELPKDNMVRVRMGRHSDEYETRELTVLSVQERQGLVKERCDAVRGMAAKKRKALQEGRKPPKQGRLKHVKRVDEIPLKQIGKTIAFTGPNLVHVQGIRGNLRLEGAERLDPLRYKAPSTDRVDELDALFGEQKPVEIACAKLVRRASGLYVVFTVYEDTIQLEARRNAHEAIRGHVPASGSELGLDAGQLHELTDSHGDTYDNRFPETPRLRNAQRRMSRRRRFTGGWWKAKRVHDLEYEHLKLRREGAARDMLHLFHTKAATLYVQDESIAEWKRRDGFVRGGRKIQHGILGRLYALFRRAPWVVMLVKWQPTTAWCPVCGCRTKHPPGKETYRCAYCGYSAPRDPHGASNMIPLGRHPVTSLQLHQSRAIPIGPYAGLGA